MSEFKTIETQEQLDTIIGERLKRQAETIEKKFSTYLSPDDVKTQVEGLNTQLAEIGNSLETEKKTNAALNETINELNSKIKTYEANSVKTRITAELGLPLEVANRIKGESEEEMRADAESLKALFGKTFTAPLANPETPPENAREAALKSMVRDLGV